ncbi:MAG: DUF3048 domain-containing protein [bacterium]
MKKKKFILILFLSTMILLSACDNTTNTYNTNNDNSEQTFVDQEEEEINKEEETMDDMLTDDTSDDDSSKSEPSEENSSPSEESSSTSEEDEPGIERQNVYVTSPFTGLPIDDIKIQKAMMVLVENSPAARPQSGLHEASIIYETLVEGGITRFLAIYWDQIPDKIGPVRSARPYHIEIAKEYDALFLHAGGSPQALEILARDNIESIDQIYSGSKHFYRSNERKPPHNLYTGRASITDYLEELLGHEYKNRFDFQRISFLTEDDQYADYIRVNFWGGTKVVYKYNEKNNNYLRYYGSEERPHISDNIQLEANNIIVQYVRTKQIDEVGRLEMDLEDRGRALLFKDGIVVEGLWENSENSWTTFYDNLGEEYSLNPGQTWIILVPDTTQVEYYLENKITEDEKNEDVDDIFGKESFESENISKESLEEDSLMDNDDKDNNNDNNDNDDNNDNNDNDDNDDDENESDRGVSVD